MKYDLTFLEVELRELLKKLKKHNTYAVQLENDIILYAQENARLKEKNEELRALYESEREVKEDYKSKNNKAIEYIYLHSTQRKWFANISDRLHNQEIQFKGRIEDLLDILKRS